MAELLEKYSGNNLHSHEIQIAMLEAYDTTYGIYNHDDPKAHPMALVTQHPKESVTEYGPLYRMFYNYHLKGVYKEFGIGIEEFLNLPREFTNLIFQILDESAELESKKQREVEDKMNSIDPNRQ